MSEWQCTNFCCFMIHHIVGRMERWLLKVVRVISLAPAPFRLPCFKRRCREIFHVVVKDANETGLEASLLMYSRQTIVPFPFTRERGTMFDRPVSRRPSTSTNDVRMIKKCSSATQRCQLEMQKGSWTFQDQPFNEFCALPWGCFHREYLSSNDYFPTTIKKDLSSFDIVSVR